MNIKPAGVAAILSLLFIVPGSVRGEFYRYVDRGGTIHFVDDRSRIPAEYLRGLEIYSENVDRMSEAERTGHRERLREDRERRGAEEEAVLLERRHRQEQFAAPEKVLSGRQPTRILLVGNQVYVPVRMSNGGREVEALLLLDTGASVTLITTTLAEQLQIGETTAANLQAVGGTVPARVAQVKQVMVGPHQKERVQVVILGDKGPGSRGDGLLGMNVLRDLKYSIDFSRQEIQWLGE